MSCRIRAVERRKCAARLSDAHPGLQDRILLNARELRMRIKYARKLNFLLCIEVQQIFGFLFSLLRHYKMLECFYYNNCCF